MTQHQTPEVEPLEDHTEKEARERKDITVGRIEDLAWYSLDIGYAIRTIMAAIAKVVSAV